MNFQILYRSSDWPDLSLALAYQNLNLPYLSSYLSDMNSYLAYQCLNRANSYSYLPYLNSHSADLSSNPPYSNTNPAKSNSFLPNRSIDFTFHLFSRRPALWIICRREPFFARRARRPAGKRERRPVFCRRASRRRRLFQIPAREVFSRSARRPAML